MAKPKKTSYFESKKLIQLRLRSKLDQRELGQKLGLSASNICYLESELKNPSIRVLIEYCLYFDLTPMELINKAYSSNMVQNYVNRLLEAGVLNPESAEKLIRFHEK